MLGCTDTFLKECSVILQSLEERIRVSIGSGVCVCDQEAVDQAFEQSGSVMALDGRNCDELIDHYCVGHLEEVQAEALSNVSHHEAAAVSYTHLTLPTILLV